VRREEDDMIRASATSRGRQAAISLVMVGALGVLLPAPSSPEPESRARDFLRTVVGFTDTEIAAVDSGRIVTKPLRAADKPEIAAFGAVRLRSDGVAFVRRIRRDVGVVPRSAAVVAVGRFSRPPRLEDLASLSFEDGEFDLLRECKPADCHLKLSRSSMERLRREIDWKAPDARARATRLLKEMLVEYVAAYLDGGTTEMATYDDHDPPLETAAEFRKLLAASPYLVTYVPELHRHLEEFPRAPLAGAEDFVYWSKDTFAPKPTVSLYHVTTWADAARGVAVMSSKRIYASHYFQAGLELGVAVAAPDGGYYLMDLYRIRINPPKGLLAGVITGKIRGGIERGVSARLKADAALETD
jgi:hypothetical protein